MKISHSRICTHKITFQLFEKIKKNRNIRDFKGFLMCNIHNFNACFWLKMDFCKIYALLSLLVFRRVRSRKKTPKPATDILVSRQNLVTFFGTCSFYAFPKSFLSLAWRARGNLFIDWNSAFKNVQYLLILSDTHNFLFAFLLTSVMSTNFRCSWTNLHVIRNIVEVNFISCKHPVRWSNNLSLSVFCYKKLKKNTLNSYINCFPFTIVY
jgi:hypothetical protein